MVKPLILVRDNNGDLHNQEGHLRNAAGNPLATVQVHLNQMDAREDKDACGTVRMVRRIRMHNVMISTLVGSNGLIHEPGHIRRYAVHPSVGMRSPTEFELAPDEGAGEVSSFFGFCPFPLTPLTWRTLMAIKCSGNSMVFLSGRYVFVKVQEPVGYPTSWRTVDVSHPVSFAGEVLAKLIMGVPQRFRLVTFLVSKEALRHSRIWGNVPRSSASVLYDEYHKTKVRKRHPSYTPPPRLARATLSANGMFSTSSTNAEVVPNRDLLADAHQRFIGETFLLRSQMRDVVEKNIGAIWDAFSTGGARRFSLDPWIVFGTRRFPQTIRSFLRPRGPSLDPEIIIEAWRRSGDRIGTLVYLDPESHGNPKEPRGSSLDPETFGWNPEAIREPGGTIFHLPRQDYYRKSLTVLRGCWYGCCYPSARLHYFPPRSALIQILFTLVLWGPRCALGCTGGLGSVDSILGLAHTHSCFMSHTRIDFVDVPLWSCHFLQGLARIGGLWRPDPARTPL
ncbi:hypothetical protein F2Q69_00053319 [Brassica cretica]|uniref:Uncharacterized protein n=1 Tax=Brassica cretica TaxID=69181 RepID=A0A8S9MVK2_BRACR|nr:hypothetical protein F2Q69_00053319 [Brassica cretica]